MRLLLTSTRLTAAGLWVVCVVLAAVAIAQTFTPGEVRLSSHPYLPHERIRAESRLVQLEVVVRDKYGRTVAGLTKDDFTVYDSRKSRELAAFSAETSNSPSDAVIKPTNTGNDAVVPRGVSEAPPPGPPEQKVPKGRWIALLFDDINTVPGDLARAKIAAKRFIQEAIADSDHIGVFTTSAGQVLDFSVDSTAIQTAVAEVQSHLRIAPGGLALCPRMTAYEAYRIVINDPSAMQAKVNEACGCSGAPVCNISEMELLSVTSGAVKDPTGGGVTISEVVVTVKAQAEQTWNQAWLASRATLDSVKVSIEQVARKPGRRMLLLASSGFLSGMLEEDQDAIVSEALRDGVVINSVDAKGLYAEAPGPPINETVEALPTSATVFQIQSLADRLDSLDSAMARFAESTGGLLFRNNNDLDLGFRQLGLLPSYTYLLAFPPVEDGKYHKIKVELKNKSHALVQVRPGYFAPEKMSGGQPSPPDKIDVEMRSSGEKTDFPASSSVTLKATALGAWQLTIQTHVDFQKLPFQRQKDRHVEKLTFVAALLDPQGNFVIGKEADMELALKPESFEHFSKTGISGVMSLGVAPGTYRLRVVVQEAIHGNMSTTSKNIHVP